MTSSVVSKPGSSEAVTGPVVTSSNVHYSNRIYLASCIVAICVYVCLLLNYQDESITGPLRRLMDEALDHLPHKDLFPLDSSDIWGTILITLGLLIAASGGIGGGGILVPLFILVFGFRPRYAIPLSNFCILGSSITNMVLNLPKRHPNANRPLVDWDLILVMEPLTMAGAIVGAFLSKILPDWILVIALVALLAFTTYTTLEKGIQQFKKETKYFEDLKKSELIKAQEAQEEEDEESESQPLLSQQAAPKPTEEAKPLTTAEVESAAREMEVNAELRNLMEEESKTPWDKVQIVSVMIGVVMVLNLLKGGGSGGFPSPLGFDCGSYGYWFLTALVFVWILGISYHMRNQLIEKWKLKKRLRFKYIEGDVEWNPINTITYPCICFFAGFFAGLFGIGGGIVKGPLMLHMGINPLVASGTVAVMIMFTSVAATTMFIAFGTLTWDYAWYFFVIGLAATVVGQFGVSYLVNKYKRVSLVSLSIGAVVAISTVLMAIQSIFSLMDSEREPQSGTICGK